MAQKKDSQKERTNCNKITKTQKKYDHATVRPYKLQGIALPKSPSKVKEMIQDLLTWSEDEDALRYKDFATERNIPYDLFLKYIERTPEGRHAWQVVKERIASRREKGALKNSLNANVVMKTQALYDADFKEYEKWKANLKQEQEQGQNTVVVLERYPETDEVPHLHTEEH